MKFRDIPSVRRGKRAIKRVDLPLVNRPCFLKPDVPELMAQRAMDAHDAIEAGEPTMPESVQVGVRVLTGSELSDVYAKAREYAVSKGGQAHDADPNYSLGLNVYLCAIACVDPDSSPEDPEPFFGERGDIESAALELFQSPHIGKEGFEYIAQAQALWQDLCSPSALRMSPRDMVEAVRVMGGDDVEAAMRTFLALRPGMLWHCMRFGASQQSILQTLKSSTGSISPDTSSSGSEPSAPNEGAAP